MNVKRSVNTGVMTLVVMGVIFAMFGLNQAWSRAEFAESPGEKEKTVMKEEYPEVLLEDDVKEFYDLIGRFGNHAVAVGNEVYPQPCVYLSLHLIQMRSAGWKDVDFDQIAAVSGASALFGYEPGMFEPKYANRSIGMDERIAEATGFGYEWIKYYFYLQHLFHTCRR